MPISSNFSSLCFLVSFFFIIIYLIISHTSFTIYCYFTIILSTSLIFRQMFILFAFRKKKYIYIISNFLKSVHKHLWSNLSSKNFHFIFVNHHQQFGMTKVLVSFQAVMHTVSKTSDLSTILLN